MPLPPKKPRKKRRPALWKRSSSKPTIRQIIQTLRNAGFKIREHPAVKEDEIIELSAFGEHSLIKTFDGIFIRAHSGKTFLIDEFKQWSWQELDALQPHLIGEKAWGKQVFRTSIGDFIQVTSNSFICMKDIQTPMSIVYLR